MTRVEQHYGSEVTGARLMALGQLGQPELVLATRTSTPAGITPENFEDACDQSLARGIAARTLRQFDLANANLSVALFLSHALEMTYREQLIRIELGQLLTTQGRPDPEMLEETMSMPVQTSARRRAYGMYALAEACMAVGDYQKAMNLLAAPSGPHPDLWAFAAAVLGLEQLRDADVQAGIYTDLAYAIWALRDGTEVELPTISPNSPEAEYGTLLQAAALMRVRSMSRHARRKLEAPLNLTPDQRVWQLMGRIHAAALAERDDDVLRLGSH
ncbi:hypothetical protein [Deinococcus cavernae]|nr:hypothetical protein [Deinococcus cavernae]